MSGQPGRACRKEGGGGESEADDRYERRGRRPGSRCRESSSHARITAGSGFRPGSHATTRGTQDATGRREIGLITRKISHAYEFPNPGR